MSSSSRSNLLRDAGVGLMILAAVALLAFMAARLGAVGGFRGGREIIMVFDDATGLVESAPIAASGVKIGSVARIEFADGGAKVTARLAPGIQVYGDATAAIRAKSLLGEKFVGLDPGHESAGALAGDRVKTTPAADIDRMAAAIARAAEALDPKDVAAIAHGLAVALSDADGVGKTMPTAIRDVGRDLHALAQSLEGVSAQGTEIANRLKPILTHLDEVTGKSGRTLDDLEPTLKRIPATMERMDSVLRRLDSVLAKADRLDRADLRRELQRIFEEEGIYVRLKSRKIGDGKTSAEDTDPETTPSPKATKAPPRL